VIISGWYAGAARFFEPGRAYIFSTNGTLLATLTGPIPAGDFGPLAARYDGFGRAVAAVGDKVLVSAPEDYGGAYEARVYLFNAGNAVAPLLTVERLTNGSVRVSWPQPGDGWVLDEGAEFEFASQPPPNPWSQVPFPYQTNATQISVMATPVGRKFYRLRQL
jgi:hypothetical protein